jgi:general stress protein YciG
MPLKEKTTPAGKCRAKTKKGGRCAAPAARGGAFCAFHSDPTRAAELGRKGGARNRKLYDCEPANVDVPESAGDVRRMLGEALAETRAGKMDPKVGSTLAYISIAWLRTFDADPPPPPPVVNIYRALDLKLRRGTGNTETIAQRELQAPGGEAWSGLPAPTTEAAVLQAGQEDEVEILDY